MVEWLEQFAATSSSPSVDVSFIGERKIVCHEVNIATDSSFALHSWQPGSFVHDVTTDT